MTKDSVLDRHTVSRRSSTERGSAWPEFRTRFHCKNVNRDAELGRVGCLMCRGQGSATDPSPRHKTNFYNMLEKEGQTSCGLGDTQFFKLENCKSCVDSANRD